VAPVHRAVRQARRMSCDQVGTEQNPTMQLARLRPRRRGIAGTGPDHGKALATFALGAGDQGNAPSPRVTTTSYRSPMPIRRASVTVGTTG
jgi:hypothetical protein